MDTFMLVLAGVYLVASVFATAMTAWSAKMAHRKVGFRELFFIFLLGPVIMGLGTVLHWLFASSDEPAQLVYARLNLSQWKTAAQIAAELKAAGQSVNGGWNEERRVAKLLETMAEDGRARRRVMGERRVYLRGDPPRRGGKQWWLSSLRPVRA